MRLTPAILHKYFKESGRLLISEHDGSFWATDSYLLVRAPELGSVASLLAEYNLPLEPMRCDVERTITRQKDKDRVPVANLFAGERKPITPWTLHGEPVLRGSVYEPWVQSDRLLLAVSQRKREIVEALCGFGGVWAAVDALKPLSYTVEGVMMGLLMPVRTRFSGEKAP